MVDADTRADVVSLLGERLYDPVISDLRMPALNAPVFYQLLKDSCGGFTPPVIFSIARGHTPNYAAFLMRLVSSRSRFPPPISARRSSVFYRRAPKGVPRSHHNRFMRGITDFGRHRVLTGAFSVAIPAAVG